MWIYKINVYNNNHLLLYGYFFLALYKPTFFLSTYLLSVNVNYNFLNNPLALGHIFTIALDKPEHMHYDYVD